MSSTRTLRSPYKTNCNKYEDALKEVVKQEMCRVFLWLYKGGDQYVGDYLNTLPKGLKCMDKKQKDLLAEKTPPTKMDIALLYRLLQLTCGLAKADNIIWNDPQPSEKDSLEHSLYLLKEERNHISHTTQREMDDAEFDDKIENLRILCCKILCEAARKCDRHSEISMCIDKTQAKFQDIRGITPQVFAQMAKEERQKARKLQEEQGKIIQDQGYISPLMVNKEGATMPLEELLKCRYDDGSSPDIILVSGEAGVGKTSLSRYLEESWMHMRDEIQDLQSYDLLLGIHCRDVYTSDITRLMIEDLLPETTAWCDPYKLPNLLLKLRMIWVLDGLEEATEDATKLIHRMLDQKPQSHTLLITSRPEHGLNLQHKYAGNKIFRVNLCGVEPTEVFKRMISKDGKKSSKNRVDQFVAEFETLDKEVQKELQNPLKMHLALQDWKNIRRDHQEGLDLSRLYQRIRYAHIESLVRKVTKGNVTTKEAERKVDKWFDLLCKVAFHMTRAQKMNTFINGDELKELEDECDNLHISSSECMSTFLAHHASKAPSGCTRYSFFHSTQQYFLAALHGVDIIKKSSDVLSDTYGLFGISRVGNDSNKPEVKQSLVHFQEVLLHMISVHESPIEDEVVEVLVNLLSYAIPEDLGNVKWFQVVQKGSYDERITEEVSKVIPEEWFISDSFVQAARHLLRYTKPNHIVIQLLKSPRDSHSFLPLLQDIADLQNPVYVELYLSYHFLKWKNYSFSDKYLEVLSQKDSCAILGFEGYLSDEGYDLLTLRGVARYCKVLRLKVKSTESIALMCDSIREINSLKIIQLTLALRNPSFISANLPDGVDLCLPYMNDETMVDTAKLTSRLSHAYKSITVNDISGPEAAEFVQRLQEKGVKVQSFVRDVIDEETGRHIFVSYGQLPFPYSFLEFKMYWLYWKRFLSKHTEDQAM